MALRKEISKFGLATNVQTVSTPLDIWDYSGSLPEYPFQETAIPLYVSSDNILDVGIPVFMEGLDQNGLLREGIAILNGQTQVPFSGLWLRQYRASNANHGQLFLGTIYIAEFDTLDAGVPETATKIKSVILPKYQQTLMCIYTFPRNFEGRILRVGASLLPKTTATAYATLGMYVRAPGQSFMCWGLVGVITSGTSLFDIPTIIGDPALPLMDVVMRVMDVSANGVEVSGWFDVKFTRELFI